MVLRKYLYLTNTIDLEKIISSKCINNGKRNKDAGAILNSKKQAIVAFIYNISMISESKCYICYPLDFMSKKITIWKKILGFIPFPISVYSHKIPDNLSAITFDIENEKHIENWYLYDTSLSKPLYCESVSTTPLRIKNVHKIEITQALEIIGLQPPYLSFEDQYRLNTGVTISHLYELGE